MSSTKFPAVFATANLVAPCALQSDGAIAHAYRPPPFGLSLPPRLRAALFSPSF